MIENWYLIMIPAVSALTGLITAGVVMAIGGLGVLRAMHRRLILAEERIEDTDARITTEIKRRAALLAVEAKKASPESQARDFLANNPQAPVVTSRRPSIVGR